MYRMMLDKPTTITKTFAESYFMQFNLSDRTFSDLLGVSPLIKVKEDNYKETYISVVVLQICIYGTGDNPKAIVELISKEDMAKYITSAIEFQEKEDKEIDNKLGELIW